jgi:TolB-like protein/DNA-binding winged helix-turn-helix (wHTH) protein/Tfp pilus assembly protein PilF
MLNKARNLYEFGPFRIDPDHRQLLRQNQPVPLQPKSFDILLVLVENSEKVVSKDELLKAVWPDTFVEESNLAQCIFVLRKTLGDTVEEKRYIVTVPGRGYRFAGTVRAVAAEEERKEVVERAEEKEEDQILLASRSLQKLVIEGANTTDSSFTFGSQRQGARSAIVVVIIAGLTVAAYVTWRHHRTVPAANPGRVMLAVLPFQNLTGDPDQEYFADGLTEEMITKLGQLHPEQLGVIARTSVMGYKNSNERLDRIARELSVQYVLEGSYRRDADHLRVTAQLIQVKDQSHLWAEEYDRQPQEILSVQDDVALAIAYEIGLRLTPQQRERLTAHAVSPEAHENYLKGRFFWNKRTEEGFRMAIGYFQTAIAKDPNYAEAYAGLADAYLLLGGYGFEAQTNTLPKAKEAALRATGINDTLVEPYTSLGLIYALDWSWRESEKSFKRAIELNPNYAVAHHWYGAGLLSALPGRTEEEISELRKARDLDPLSPTTITDLAAYLCFAGRFDEGMELFQEVLKIDPDFVVAHYYLSEAYELQGKYPEAIAEVKKIRSPDATRYGPWLLGHIYALQGRRREALEAVSQLQQLSKRTYVDSAYVANIYVALGDKDLAFIWLEKALQEHSPTILGLETNWRYDAIRSDSRFSSLVRRVGLP